MPRDDHKRADLKSIQSHYLKANLRQLEAPIDPLNPPPLPDTPQENREKRARGSKVSKAELLKFINHIERKVASKDKRPCVKIGSLNQENHHAIIRILDTALEKRFRYEVGGRPLDSLQLVKLACKCIGDPAVDELLSISKSRDRNVQLNAKHVLEKIGVRSSQNSVPTASKVESLRERIRIENETKIPSRQKRKRKTHNSANLNKKRILSTTRISHLVSKASNLDTPEIKQKSIKSLLSCIRPWMASIERVGVNEKHNIAILLSMPIVQIDVMRELLSWAGFPEGAKQEASLQLLRECREKFVVEKAINDLESRGGLSHELRSALTLLRERKRDL